MNYRHLMHNYERYTSSNATDTIKIFKILFELIFV